MTNYQAILEKVYEKALKCGRRPDDITVVAVSKQISAEKVAEAYQAGCRDFGENRLPEALNKIALLPNDCRWHFIGTLQSNKISRTIGNFHLIHSADHLELVRKISKSSAAQNVTTPLLLQVNTSGEKTKHGLSAEEWQTALPSIRALTHIQVQGLMTMAPLTDDEKIIRSCFRTLCRLKEQWHADMTDPACFRHLSMGMSHDYEIAIEEGATLLRIGTAIFMR